MSQLKQLIQTTIVSLLALMVISCAYTKETLNLETDVTIDFTIASQVNPDEDGRASPIVINVLYLKDNRQFEQEDFIALLEDPESRLGKDLIEKIRLKEFIPAEQREISYVLPEGVNYVGLIGEFIQYQDASGKLVLPIERHSGNDFGVVVEKDTMKITD